MKLTQQSIKETLGDNIQLTQWFHHDTKQVCDVCMTKHCNYTFLVEGKGTHDQLLVGINCMKLLGYDYIDVFGKLVTLQGLTTTKLIKVYNEKEEDYNILHQYNPTKYPLPY